MELCFLLVDAFETRLVVEHRPLLPTAYYCSYLPAVIDWNKILALKLLPIIVSFYSSRKA